MYEAYYNRAIIHIGNGDYLKAEKSLKNAKAELENYDDFEPEELEQGNSVNFIKNQEQPSKILETT